MELAGYRDAAQAANLVVTSYSQMPPEPDVFLAQLTELFLGVPIAVLSQLTSPVDGLVAQEEFLSIAAAKKWIDRRTRPYGVLEAEAETLRERREAEKWAEARAPKDEREQKAREMQLKAADLGKGFPMPPKQVDDWDKRLEALKTLEAK